MCVNDMCGQTISAIQYRSPKKTFPRLRDYLPAIVLVVLSKTEKRLFDVLGRDSQEKKLLEKLIEKFLEKLLEKASFLGLVKQD